MNGPRIAGIAVMIPAILELALFWFVLLGSKLVLGAVVLHMLLPRDRSCAVCDAELIPLEPAAGSARVMRLLRLQRLWCVECDRQSLGRMRGTAGLMPRAARPVAEFRAR
jgi:hypothetical protein